jgi:hypothetical protein
MRFSSEPLPVTSFWKSDPRLLKEIGDLVLLSFPFSLDTPDEV